MLQKWWQKYFLSLRAIPMKNQILQHSSMESLTGQHHKAVTPSTIRRTKGVRFVLRAAK
jgi:hypothetical protein